MGEVFDFEEEQEEEEEREEEESLDDVSFEKVSFNNETKRICFFFFKMIAKHGLGNKDYSLTVDVGEKLKNLENSENVAIFENLRGCLKLCVNKYLPLVREWVDIFTRAESNVIPLSDKKKKNNLLIEQTHNILNLHRILLNKRHY